MFTSLMPHLFTADIDRATAFYRDQLGFAQSFRYPSEGQLEHVELRLGESVLALSTREAAHEAGLAPSAGNPMELIVWCGDVDASVEKLRANGATVIAEPYNHIAHRRASVSDPDGNWVALIGDKR
jgi:lactoylglutathione lyase